MKPDYRTRFFLHGLRHASPEARALVAPWPCGFEPCAGDEFQPIVDEVDVAQVVHGA